MDADGRILSPSSSFTYCSRTSAQNHGTVPVAATHTLREISVTEGSIAELSMLSGFYDALAAQARSLLEKVLGPRWPALR